MDRKLLPPLEDIPILGMEGLPSLSGISDFPCTHGGLSEEYRYWSASFQRTYAKKLFARAVCEAPPDLIIVGEPPHSAGSVAKRLARRFAIPVVFDVLDLWPELFSLALPPLLRPLSNLLFSPLYLLRSQNFRMADGVMAVCDTYLETALRSAPHLRNIRSTSVYLGVDVEALRRRNSSVSCEDFSWGRKNPGELGRLRRIIGEKL